MKELTHEEKEALKKLSQGDDKRFLKNVNEKELDYLLSIVDRQDCQHSHIHAVYVNELDILKAEFKNNLNSKFGSKFNMQRWFNNFRIPFLKKPKPPPSPMKEPPPMKGELTYQEKAALKKLSQGEDKSFLKNVNRKELNYLLSIVDRQDCQHSYRYAVYVNELDKLDKMI